MTATAKVILFRQSGKYYTEEEWTIPTKEEAKAAGAVGGDTVIPYIMAFSPDARQIDRGPVLVVTQAPWGYPHLITDLPKGKQPCEHCGHTHPRRQA